MKPLPDDALARRLARMLDRRALSPRQAAALAAARHAALASGSRPAAVLTRAARATPWFGLAASCVLVLAVSLTGDLFEREPQVGESPRIDRALLADDLPIDAYLDEGFHAWLSAS